MKLNCRRKGFVTLWALGLLLLTASIGSDIAAVLEMDRLFHADDDLFYRANWVEVLTIGYVRTCLRDYSEADEVIFFDGFIIDISYDDLQAAFTITQGNFVRERVLVYDDIDDSVTSYY